MANYDKPAYVIPTIAINLEAQSRAGNIKIADITRPSAFHTMMAEAVPAMTAYTEGASGPQSYPIAG